MILEPFPELGKFKFICVSLIRPYWQKLPCLGKKKKKSCLGLSASVCVHCSTGSLLFEYFDYTGVSLTLWCFVVYSARRFVVCLILCHFVLVFFSPFSIAITSLGEVELILGLFVCLIDLCLFGFVGYLFLLMSGKGCGLWLWHSLDFSLTFLAFICFRHLWSLRPIQNFEIL